MGRTAEKTTDGVPPKEMDKMERNLEQLTGRLTELRKKIMTLEEQVSFWHHNYMQAVAVA